jgi:hypothetical protein
MIKLRKDIPKLGKDEVLRHVQGYTKGYPDKAELYPVFIGAVNNDDGSLTLTGRFVHKGKEYRNTQKTLPDAVLFMEVNLIKGLRKKLSSLGAIIWPPPIDDLKAWGAEKEE